MISWIVTRVSAHDYTVYLSGGFHEGWSPFWRSMLIHIWVICIRFFSQDISSICTLSNFRCVSRYEFKCDFKIAMTPFYFAATATLRQPTILFIKKDRIEYSKSICQSRAFGFCIKITLFRSMNLAQISSSQYKCKKLQTKVSFQNFQKE